MFTKNSRQAIVEDFARRHNGQFSAPLFVKEVSETGRDHPAHGWFEWRDDKAAESYRVEQAREFARGLRVVFKIEEIGRRGAIRVRETTMPYLISPMSGRNSGGGYYIMDADNPAHMREFCAEAAEALQAWLDRYDSALAFAKLPAETVVRVVNALEKLAPDEVEEEAA